MRVQVPLLARLKSYLLGILVYGGAVGVILAINGVITGHPPSLIPTLLGVVMASCLGIVDAHLRLLRRWTPTPRNDP